MGRWSDKIPSIHLINVDTFISPAALLLGQDFDVGRSNSGHEFMEFMHQNDGGL